MNFDYCNNSYFIIFIFFHQSDILYINISYYFNIFEIRQNVFIFFDNFFYILFIVIKLCSKYNILIDDKSEKHKNFQPKKKTNLLGGFLLIIFLLLSIR